MDWNDVRVFLAIAREGTLCAAARHLGRTQPTMGRRLKVLEESVGQKLFQRTVDGFVLTEEGVALVAHAERMEEEVLTFQRQLTGEEQQLEGLLRITSSDWFGTHLLSPVLVEFANLNPHVSIELLTDTRFYSLSKCEADIAFRIQPFDEPNVVSRKLLRMRYAAYVLKGDPHPIAGDGNGTLLITMDTAHENLPCYTWVQSKLPNARVAFRSNNRDVQAQMCVRGAGLAVLPIPLGESFPELEIVDLGDEPPSRDTWVGYHQDLRRLKRLRMLLDLVIERLSD
ncbi:MAG: LysR family transcriptional regulator [Pseudomonas sp.]